MTHHYVTNNTQNNRDQKYFKFKLYTSVLVIKRLFMKKISKNVIFFIWVGNDLSQGQGGSILS